MALTASWSFTTVQGTHLPSLKPRRMLNQCVDNDPCQAKAKSAAPLDRVKATFDSDHGQLSVSRKTCQRLRGGKPGVDCLPGAVSDQRNSVGHATRPGRMRASLRKDCEAHRLLVDGLAKQHDSKPASLRQKRAAQVLKTYYYMRGRRNDPPRIRRSWQAHEHLQKRRGRGDRLGPGQPGRLDRPLALRRPCGRR